MIVQGLARGFMRDLLQSLASHTFVIALYNQTAQLSPMTEEYTTAGEVGERDANGRATGYRPGGLALTGFRVGFENGVSFIDWDDPVWPVSNIVARGAMIYDLTLKNRTVGIMDMELDYISTNGPFTVVLPDPTSDKALVRIR